jgi:pimeloyl-ACP methyl ester carboxylesterase
VVTAAAPADAGRLDPDAADRLRRDGRLASPSGRTGQTLHVGRDWLDQIEADPAGHDPLEAATNFPGRLLVVHGDADPTVPPLDLERYRRARPDAEFALLPHANHVFNAPNPLPPDDELPTPTAELFDRVLEFLTPTYGTLWT